MPSPLNPPDSPNAQPVVPEGLTTKLGKAAIALLALVAAVSAFLDGDHSEETITAIAGAVATLVALTASRGYQAGQAIRVRVLRPATRRASHPFALHPCLLPSRSRACGAESGPRRPADAHRSSHPRFKHAGRRAGMKAGRNFDESAHSVKAPQLGRETSP